MIRWPYKSSLYLSHFDRFRHSEYGRLKPYKIRKGRRQRWRTEIKTPLHIMRMGKFSLPFMVMCNGVFCLRWVHGETERRKSKILPRAQNSRLRSFWAWLLPRNLVGECLPQTLQNVSADCARLPLSHGPGRHVLAFGQFILSARVRLLRCTDAPHASLTKRLVCGLREKGSRPLCRSVTTLRTVTA